VHSSDGESYEAKVRAEKSFYRSCAEVHCLPEIFHYWSNRHMRPELLRFGFGSPNEMFRKFLGEQFNGQKRERRFLSLGAGNCDLEIQLALQLRAETGVPFLVDCLELNPAMLERGRAAAQAAGIANQFTFVETDLNRWRAEHEYDAVVANQCLHHIVNLEGLLAEVKRCLRPSGSFVVSDMIGRNGHQRWPEALDVVHEFWRRLPPSYRFNRLLGRYEELYEDWDCSAEGFEGIRSQEILPLLREQFQFRLFLAFGNAIDPFIERAFGPNFDAAAEWDRNFIDQIHLRDEQELQSGRLKPTRMMAVLTNAANGAQCACRGSLTPEFCVRAPDRAAEGSPSEQESPEPYDWDAWPHDAREQLVFVCQKLQDCGNEIQQRTIWAMRLEEELTARTKWALGLNKELEEWTAWACSLEQQLKEQAARELRMLGEAEEHKRQLEQEIAERTRWAQGLEREFEERTAWALRLREEVEEQKRVREELEREIHRYIRNPFRLAARIVRGVQRRLRRKLTL
jgi:SAM-dependent methyltransferase